MKIFWDSDKNLLTIFTKNGRYEFMMFKPKYIVSKCILCDYGCSFIESPTRILKFGIKSNSLCSFCTNFLSTKDIYTLCTIRCGKIIIPPVIQKIEELCGSDKKYLYPVGYEEIRR